MKKLILTSIILVGLVSSKISSAANLNIFACEPEWGSLAREITQDQAVINIATTAKQNPHFMQAKPSLISAISRADLVVCSGSDLEIGWLPVLIEKANNNKARPGSDGYLMASDYVIKVEIPQGGIDRSLGDIHPYGNPHIHLDPRNISLVALELLKRLKKIDPEHQDFYQKNYQNFINKWQQSIIRWEKQANKLKGTAIVVQHSHWSYLNNWLGLKTVARLEEKPGIAPSSKYLATVLTNLKTNPARLIIYSPFENKEPILWLNQQTKIKAVLLPYTIGGNEEVTDLFSLFDQTIIILNRESN